MFTFVILLLTAWCNCHVVSSMCKSTRSRTFEKSC